MSEVEIDAAAGSATKAAGAEVSAVETTPAGVAWTRNGERLTHASGLERSVDQAGDCLVGLRGRAGPGAATSARAAAGRYSLSIDGAAVGVYSADELSAGINLAVLPTPMLKQALEVAKLTVDHNNVHFARWRTLQVPLEKYNLTSLPATLTDLDEVEKEIVAQQHTAAQPKSHRFEITAAQ